MWFIPIIEFEMINIPCTPIFSINNITMNKKQILLGLACLPFSLLAQRNHYEVYMNLDKVVDDKLKVEILTPALAEDTIEFQMPKIVPGTYSIYDFGRFLSDVHAFDIEGNELAVTNLSTNRWQIVGATKLEKISYWAEDTYDSEQDNRIFEPAGTNFEEGKNYLLNNFGIVGYLEGHQKLPFYLNISKPAGFYGATAMKMVNEGAKKDRFMAENYFDLHDMPIMYCKPDTATLKIGNTEVLVSVYSPKGLLSADFVKSEVDAIMHAQEKYLGGKLPVDKYAILIYLFDGFSPSGSAGALEHSYSTVFAFPELKPEMLAGSIRDVTAHEFFHIVTPLTIHSEHIHDYNFIDPQMSQHLWLYEGVTEYSAQLVQVKYDLFTPTEFLDVVSSKMKSAARYNDTLPFTEMSKGALDVHASQYGNVYQKGALIGMCLDIIMREKSEGKYGIQELLADLSEKYGKDAAFEDEKLFEEIEKLTYPEVGEFLRTYVSGNKAIPYQELLAKAGIDFQESVTKTEITLGNPNFSFNPETQRLVIAATLNVNKFGREIGYKEGDELVSINGEEIKLETIEEQLNDFKTNTKEGKKVKVVVMRGDEKVTLKAKAVEVEIKDSFVLSLKAEPSTTELKTRNTWLNID
jgi:predicted metalloprotease with PDZ domain